MNVLLTLLGMEPKRRAKVASTALHRAGELCALAAIANPDDGIAALIRTLPDVPAPAVRAERRIATGPLDQRLDVFNAARQDAFGFLQIGVLATDPFRSAAVPAIGVLGELFGFHPRQLGWPDLGRLFAEVVQDADEVRVSRSDPEAVAGTVIKTLLLTSSHGIPSDALVAQLVRSLELHRGR